MNTICKEIKTFHLVFLGIHRSYNVDFRPLEKGTCPPPPKKIAVPPPCASQMRSVLCMKMDTKIFLKCNAADKPNGVKCDCIRIHALHGCVITYVITQQLPVQQLPAFPQPRSQGFISAPVAR